jgi:hypothetical protein
MANVHNLLKATPPDQRTDVRFAKREKTNTPIEKLEKAMSQVQETYQTAESNNGCNILNYVIAKGCLLNLLVNVAVKSCMGQQELEILTHL